MKDRRYMNPIDELAPPVGMLDSYFHALERYKEREKEAEWEIDDLRCSYTLTTTDEVTGITVIGASVENNALKIVDLQQSLKKTKKRAERKEAILHECLGYLPQRWELLLNTFYRTGDVLTNQTELKQAQERLAYEIGLHLYDEAEREKERRSEELKERVKEAYFF